MKLLVDIKSLFQIAVSCLYAIFFKIVIEKTLKVQFSLVLDL